MLTGCTVTSRTVQDPNFKACIEAGGSYREPVTDDRGFSCTLPGGAR